VRITAELLTHNPAGDQHAPGTLVRARDGSAYLVETGLTLRRVQVVGDGLCRMVHKPTKAERKKLKRQRQKARSDLAAAALRVAARQAAIQEPSRG
jgi:hypothetical protein